MKILESDITWLKASFPNLRYNADAQRIVGELDFCAAFNKRSGRLQFGSDPTARTLYTYLCDVFEIEIHLGPGSIQKNGWPKVYEVGGRYNQNRREEQRETHRLTLFRGRGLLFGHKTHSRKKPDDREFSLSTSHSLLLPAVLYGKLWSRGCPNKLVGRVFTRGPGPRRTCRGNAQIRPEWPWRRQSLPLR